MIKPKRILLDLLTDFKNVQSTQQDLSFTINLPTFNTFKSEELAQLYVDVAFLRSSINFLTQEHWLQLQNKSIDSKSIYEFLNSFYLTELLPIQFLQSTLEKSNLQSLKLLEKKLSQLENAVILFIQNLELVERKQFLTTSLKLMTALFEFESRLQNEKRALGLHLGLTLYRSFDSLDQVLRLKYEADSGMKTDLKITERLYEGAGPGVQSGYSTVLIALAHLKPKTGSRFVDLGSGYGRVGMIVGLVRPDIKFEGYEYVEHRVLSSRSSALALGFQEQVKFHTQDLSLKEFKIPLAEIYYLYDPFSEETYAHVLNQLVEISTNQSISIVTKGNARSWLLQIAQRQGWASPVEFDNGNLCVFKS